MIVAVVLIVVLALVVFGVWVWFRIERRRAVAIQSYLNRCERTAYQVLREGSPYRYQVLEEPPARVVDVSKWSARDVERCVGEIRQKLMDKERLN